MKISLFDNTISRRIVGMPANIEKRVSESMMDGIFVVQVDESTDIDRKVKLFTSTGLIYNDEITTKILISKALEKHIRK